MSSDNLISRIGKPKGRLVIVSGPSGVGKGTICREVVKRSDAELSVSATTRAPGNGEENGRDYWFMTKDEFETKISENGFLEYAEIFDNYYGTLRDKVQLRLDEGKTVILEIDVQGAKQVMKLYPHAVKIFILPPNQQVLRERMRSRGRDDGETEDMRIQQASNEISVAWQYYDNMVINDDLEQAVQEVIEIIESNKN